MRRMPLTTFFVLAFALPWLVWGTALAHQRGILGWHVPGPLAFWVGLPVATFGAAALTGGVPALRDLVARMVRVRVGVRWYLAALLVPPALGLVALVLAGPLGVQVSRPTTSVVAVAGVLLFNVWMWLLTEEAAWRGFALPRMEKQFGPVAASVLLGVLWACWHLPLFLMTGTFQSTIPFGGFLISTVATSVLIGTVCDGARGSVVIAALCHAATDVTIATAGVMTSGALLFWLFVSLQVLTALACVPVLRRVGTGGLDGLRRPLQPRHA